MCGIAGFSGATNAEDAGRILRQMTRAIAHRGPDGEGFWSDRDQSVHLGHRRLAIIDRAGGDQPMWDAQGNVGVVFNGEIYNHRELRGQLTALGHGFATKNSDTEVLIHGWKAWGPDLFARLNGMFALAIYDRRCARLVLARDRFGEKPLYWHAAPGFLAFASELTALVEHKGVPREPDRRALAKFFAHGFFPAPNTPLANVQKLVAGHFLVFDVSQAALPRPQAYWRFEMQPEPGLLERPEAELAEELRALLDRAVHLRLESEVPLGFLLSGGIDSSAVAAFAAKNDTIARPQTFSMGFAEKSYDESGWARQVADAIGSRHSQETCDLASAQADLVPLLRRLDEPTADASILPTFELCRFVRKHVTVALSGDGGDELFAGYDTFRALAPTRLYRAFVPRALDPVLARLVGMLPRSDANMSLDFKLRRAMRAVAHDPSLWNPIWLGPLAPDEISAVVGERFAADELYSEAIAAWNGAKSRDPIDRTVEFYTRFYLPDGILAKTDRASMLNSLELRAPFLDVNVADFAARLPSALKLRGKTGKYLLRRALVGTVPDAVLARPKKGFGIPLSAWMRALPPPPATGILDASAVAEQWRAHSAGERDWRQAMFAAASVAYCPIFARQASDMSPGP